MNGIILLFIGRCVLPYLGKSGRLGKSVLFMSVSSSSLSSSSVSPNMNAFTELEHKNWQRGVDAYTKGFGPLTSRAVPTLLDRAGFLASNSGSPSSFRLLDVACGPGQVLDVAISMENKKKTYCRCAYVGLDFSSKFLDLAKANLRSKHPDVDVTFVEGDAQNLSSVFLCDRNENENDNDDDDTRLFDAVTSNFGILHLADPDAFLAESYQVLKPGGRLAFSTWAAPPITEGFDLILGTVRDCGNPHVTLPDGPPFFRFSKETEIRQSLKAAGYVDVDVIVVDDNAGGMEWNNINSADELYETLLEGTARTRELLRGQTKRETEVIREELKRRYERRVASNSGPGGKNNSRRHLRMPAVISSGRKPV